VDGSRFNIMFVAYTANISGFKLRCQMILFVNYADLSEPYKETMLVACPQNADDHMFNFACAIVSIENIDY